MDDDLEREHRVVMLMEVVVMVVVVMVIYWQNITTRVALICAIYNWHF